MSDTVLIALALFAGPSVAVALHYYIQTRERLYQRRLAVFQTMMRTRRLWLSQEWIGALCLAPVEFKPFPNVIAAISGLQDKFTEPAWRGSEVQRRRVVLDAEAAVCAVLQHMAEALNIELAASDLRQRNMAPTGWIIDDVHARHTREMMMQVLEGSRPLKVQPVQIATDPASAPEPKPEPAPETTPEAKLQAKLEAKLEPAPGPMTTAMHSPALARERPNLAAE
jgi:hypothetical protein